MLKSRKQKDVEFGDDYDKAAKYIDNSIKNIKTFCQKAGLTTELQNEFGDYLKELGLESDDELGETLIKLGDCLKSMATLNHIMLCNIEDNYVQPITDFRKDLANNNELSSAEQYARKCLKQEEHMKQLQQFFMCFYHYYSEGYTLTFHLREPLEKIKERSVKNVIAMRDQVMEELKPKKKPLPTTPTVKPTVPSSSSTSPDSGVGLKRQDSMFKKAPPIPKHATSYSSMSSSESKVVPSAHQYSDSSVSTASNRSSSSDESVEQLSSPRSIVTPRSIPPKPTKPIAKSQPPQPPKATSPVMLMEPTVSSPMEQPKVVIQPVSTSTPMTTTTSPSTTTNTWKKPVAPTIKRNENVNITQVKPVSPPPSEPVVEVTQVTPISNNNNSSWKKPTAPNIKKEDNTTIDTKKSESSNTDNQNTSPKQELSSNLSFKKNLEQSIQFRLPGMVNNTPSSSPTSEPVNNSPVLNRVNSKPPVPQSRRPNIQPAIPQHIAKCKVIYPYNAQNSEELTFKPGEIVLIVEKEQDFGWWKGLLESNPEKKGFFPSNYVQII